MNTNLFTSLIVSTALLIASVGTVVALPQVISGHDAPQTTIIEWK